MSKPIKRCAPTLKRHKATGHAYARFNGKQKWFGRFDDPKSHLEFAQFKALWEANHRELPDECSSREFKVSDLVTLYRQHAEIYFRRADGSNTHEVVNIRYTVAPMLELYAELPAPSFSLRCLKQVREQMIESGLARKTVNERVWRLLRIFAWGAEEELLPPETYGALRVLRPLKPGRTLARETVGISPVSEADFFRTLPHLTSPVRAMALLQWHTGMRPGEVVSFRLCDLEDTDLGLVYKPKHHKTAYRGLSRVIPLGPRSLEVLQPFRLRVPSPDKEMPLFSPKDSMAERHARAHKESSGRKAKDETEPEDAPMSPRQPGDQYTTDSYRRAITRACIAARVPAWTPNRLRHSAATRIRKELGLDTARAVLGHRSAAITEIYAELDRAKAFEAMRRLG